MEPDPLYERITSRMNRLLGMKHQVGGVPQQRVTLRWDIPPQGLANHAHAASRTAFLQGTLVRDGNWLDPLVVHTELIVIWKNGLGAQNGRFSTVAETSLKIKPKPFMFYNSAQNGLILFWKDGCASMSVESVMLGKQACGISEKAGGFRARFLEDIMEWNFKEEDLDLVADDRRTFSGKFGSHQVTICFSLKKISTDLIVSGDIWKESAREGYIDEANGHAFALTKPQKNAVRQARRHLALRQTESGFFVLKCSGYDKEVRVIKSVLASHSPVFAACFRRMFSPSGIPENDLKLLRHIGLDPGSSRELCHFCEHSLVPQMRLFSVELAKLAHRFEVFALLDLCELYLMNLTVTIAGLHNAGDFLWDEFLTFVRICAVAALLDLPLLLTQLHFVVTRFDQHIMHLPVWPTWQKFIIDKPHFTASCYRAIASIQSKSTRK